MFDQIFLLFGCSNEGKVIPAAYCLLPDKRSSSYQQAFESIKNVLEKTDHLEEVMADFEPAIHKAVHAVFPQAKMSGCLFHLFQVILWYYQQSINKKID